MIQVFQGPTLRAGINFALRHRLYIPGWQLLPTLRYVLTAPSGEKLAMAFVEDRPVSLVLFTNSNFMAFTHQHHRRQGWGTKCFAALDEVGSARSGIDGSEFFWRKVGVVPDY